MRTYLVSYDLNSPRGTNDYTNLHKALKEHSGWWWHYLDSTWIIKSNMSAAQIRDILKQYIDSGDELLVVRMSGEWASVGFSKEANDWLYSHISWE